MRNKKQKASRQTRTAARVLRISDPKIRTKYVQKSNIIIMVEKLKA